MKLRRLVCLAAISLSLAPFSSASKRSELAGLPSIAQANISAVIGRDDPAYLIRAARGMLAARNPSQELALDFSSHDVTIKNGATHWSLALESYGCDTTLRPVKHAVFRAASNRVEYHR